MIISIISSSYTSKISFIIIQQFHTQTNHSGFPPVCQTAAGTCRILVPQSVYALLKRRRSSVIMKRGPLRGAGSIYRFRAESPFR